MKGEIKEIDGGFWTIWPAATSTGARIGREFRGKATDANVQVGDAVEYEVEETSTGPKLGKVTVLNPRPAPAGPEMVFKLVSPEPAPEPAPETAVASDEELKDLAAGPKE